MCVLHLFTLACCPPALHYAAEFGRFSMCSMLVARGAVLTLVEEEGQLTPCELAGEAGFGELSAWLEARAVFEEEAGGHSLLGASIHGATLEPYQSDVGPRRISPYSWFENHDLESVMEERMCRVAEAQEVVGVRRVAEEDELGKRCMVDGAFCPSKLAALATTYLPFRYTDEEVVQMMTHCGWDLEKFTVRFNGGKDGNSLTRTARYQGKDAHKGKAGNTGSCGSANNDDLIESRQQLIKECKINFTGAELQEMFEYNAWKAGSPPDVLPDMPGYDPPSTKEPAGSEVECVICYGDFDPNDRMQWTRLSTHKHATCRGCLVLHIKLACENMRGGLAIRCPFQNCRYFLSERVLEEHAGPDIWEKVSRPRTPRTPANTRTRARAQTHTHAHACLRAPSASPCLCPHCSHPPCLWL